MKDYLRAKSMFWNRFYGLSPSWLSCPQIDLNACWRISVNCWFMPYLISFLLNWSSNDKKLLLWIIRTKPFDQLLHWRRMLAFLEISHAWTKRALHQVRLSWYGYVCKWCGMSWRTRILPHALQNSLSVTLIIITRHSWEGLFSVVKVIQICSKLHVWEAQRQGAWKHWMVL